MMKKEWSPRWVSSMQPRKQRKYRHNAPLHVRQRFVSANLSPELRKRFGVRSMQLRKGDEVRVMRGGMKGKLGAVERVDLTKSKIYMEEIKVKKVDGSEVPRAMQPSNLMITKLKLDDKKRQAILDRVEEAKKPKPEKPPEKPAPEKEAKKPKEKKTEKPKEEKPAPEKEKPKKEKPKKPAAKKPAKKPKQAKKPKKKK
jgi:large subunit ribosomal protein L24